jgi:hypothetical protein
MGVCARARLRASVRVCARVLRGLMQRARAVQLSRRALQHVITRCNEAAGPVATAGGVATQGPVAARLRAARIIPVLTIERPDDAVPLARALLMESAPSTRSTRRPLGAT